VVETHTYPHNGASLVSATVYDDRHRVFYSEDPYGRREYMGYRASDGDLIRRVQGTHDAFSLADNSAVLNLVRDASDNAGYIVADAIKNVAGDLDQVIDGRGYQTLYAYDSRGRQTQVKTAAGTSVETISQTDYDLAGNVVETRAPRYFDSSDPEYQKVKTVSTYGGRNLLASTTEAPGTAVAATTSYTYYADGRAEKTHDARGNDWYSYWHTCCASSQGQKDPAGHGSISNVDHAQRTTHTALVEDYASHPSPADPVNAKTLAEATTRYDALGRVSMRTQWLTPLGVVDPDDVPIAGENGVAQADGVTSRTLYDSNLADGVGLDSATGIAVSKPGGGTYNVNVQPCLSKLAAFGKGVRSQLCTAPSGPFRQLTPDPFSKRTSVSPPIQRGAPWSVSAPNTN
jgi:hypothetical protein